MNGRLVALGVAAVAVIAVVAILAGGGPETPSPDAAPSSTITPVSVAPEAAADETPIETTASESPPVTVAAAQAVPPPAAAACTSTQQPHIDAKGIVTAIDGVPIAPQGEYEGSWFSLGNTVNVIAPEAGGPAYVWLVALISSDAGQSQSYQVGHDSRGAHAPPDPRAPENYVAYVANSAMIEGTVGLSIDSLDAGEVPTMAPAAYEQSVFTADYDAAAGIVTGTIQHPDLVVEFYADDIATADQPVFSSPECYQQAVEQARAQHNP